MANKFNMDFLNSTVKREEKQVEENIKAEPSSDILSKFKTTSEIFGKSDCAIDMLSIDKLLPYSKHPFKIKEGDRLEDLTQSIREQGILVPLIVRCHPERRGYYEILAGHHRHIASERAEVYDIPCIIKNVDDNTAALIVVESNKQRGFADMLPSEIAKALKLEYDALKCQGKRTDLTTEIEEILSLQNADKCDNGGKDGTSAPLEQKLESSKSVGNNNDMSSASVRRYIRLNNLIEDLLDMVDEDEIAIRPAVDLSYLSVEEQTILSDALGTSSYKVDMKKAEKLKEYSQNKKINDDSVRLILSGEIFNAKPKVVTQVKLPIKKIKAYIPDNLSKTDEVEEYIIKALEFYKDNNMDDELGDD